MQGSVLIARPVIVNKSSYSVKCGCRARGQGSLPCQVGSHACEMVLAVHKRGGGGGGGGNGEFDK